MKKKKTTKCNKCSVPGCLDKHSKRHRFPNPNKNQELFNKWMKRINNPALHLVNSQKIYKDNYVCNIHFSKEQIVIGTRRGLRVNAEPTINLSSAENSVVEKSVKQLEEVGEPSTPAIIPKDCLPGLEPSKEKTKDIPADDVVQDKSFGNNKDLHIFRPAMREFLRQSANIVLKRSVDGE